jgi:hypothetical protein
MYTVDRTIDNTSSAWIINITGTHVLYASADYKPNWSASLIGYRLIDSSGFSVDPPPNGTFLSIQSINGTPSSYNITWNDNDNDGCLGVGDNFTISKTGGNLGRAEVGYKFRVWGGETGEKLIEVILP